MAYSSHSVSLLICEPGIQKGQSLLRVSFRSYHKMVAGAGVITGLALHIWYHGWDGGSGWGMELMERAGTFFFSPDSLYTCAGLSFLTAWWPRGSWLLMWQLKAPRASVPRDQGRSSRTSVTQAWHSHWVLSSILCWSEQSRDLPKFKEREQRTPSMGRVPQNLCPLLNWYKGKLFLIYKFHALLLKITTFFLNSWS